MKKKYFYKNVYSSFVHNFSKLETTDFSLTWECINKWWYVHIMEYYLARKWNELLTCATSRMNLNCSLLSKISQIPKVTYHMVPLT